jgi:V/A-type H+-transporting ATPase subunit C
LSVSNNAIIAKSKAMYGNFLKASDYHRLMKMSSISEVVSYLKKHPFYEYILKDINEKSVHRGQLELLIKKNNFDRILKLIHSIYSKDKSYYELSIIKQESDLILSVLRTLINDDDLDSIKGRFPYFFEAYTDIDLTKLMSAESLDELLDALATSDYLEIIKPYYVKDKKMIRYLDIEYKLEMYYYDQAFKRINQNYKGTLKKDLNDLFYTRIELQNLIKIYRLKKFYQSDPLTIKNLLVLDHSRITDKKLDEIIHLKDPNDILNYLTHSELKYYKNNQDFIYIEYYSGKIKYDLAKKIMYFATEVPKVFTAFLTLLEIQNDNLTNIIEGIRYQVSESEMQQMLIYS